MRSIANAVKTCAVGAVIAGLLASPGLSAASAATVGGVSSGDLSSFSIASGSGAPTVLTWENFDGPDGTAISGTNPDWGPGTWRSLGGFWSIQGNEADSTSVGLGSINVHSPGTLDAAIEVKLNRFGSTTFDAGILFNDNDYSVMIMRYQSGGNGTLALTNWDGGYSTMATVTNLYPAGIATAPAVITLRVRAVGTLVEGYIDGALVLTYTLTAGEQATFKAAAHDGYGLWAEQDGTTKFDDFHIDTP